MSDRISTLPASLPSLTGIRGVAACWVVFYHVDSILGPYLPGIHNLVVFKSGFRGVDLFFILSGFILMHVHARDFLELRGRALQRFAVLRITRIYPLNTVVLCLILALVCVSPAYHAAYRERFPPLGFVETLTLTNRWLVKEAGAWNGPTWSLSYELLAYAVFPLAAFVLNSERSKVRSFLLVFGLLGSVAAYQFATGHTTDNPIYRAAIVRAVPTFIAGCVLHSLCALTRIPCPNTIAWTSCALIVIMMFVPQAGLLMPFPFAGLILVAPYQNVAVNMFLATPACLFLGRISFGLYLVHFTPLWFVGWMATSGRLPLGQVWIWTVGAVVLSFGLAVSLHELVEKPSQKFGRRWSSRMGCVTETA